MILYFSGLISCLIVAIPAKKIIISVPFALIAKLFMCRYLKRYLSSFHTSSLKYKICCYFVATGISILNCLNTAKYYIQIGISFAWLFIIICTFSVYYITVFIHSIYHYFSKTGLYSLLKKLFLKKYVIAIFAIYVFSIGVICFKTNVFYDSIDVVYTFDNMPLMNLLFDPLDCDIKKPLFSLFSIPLYGFIPYLYILQLPEQICSAVMITINSLYLILANLLLSHIVFKDNYSSKKTLFFVMQLLTSAMMFGISAEHYNIAYFWMMILIYQKVNTGKIDELPLLASAGSIITNFAFIPILFGINWKNVGKVLKHGLEYMLHFIVLIFACGKFYYLINFKNYVSVVGKFTSVDTSLIEKIQKYSHFLKNLFFLPDGYETIVNDMPSWQTVDQHGLSILGIVILFACVVGFMLSRKEYISNVAAYWVVFSIFIIVIGGWGIPENGLVLYTLYFGWAYVILLFKFVYCIFEWLNNNRLLIAIPMISIILLLFVNIPSVIEIVQFAATKYPI